MDNEEKKANLGTTRDFRLERKAIKEIFSSRPEGITKDELAISAKSKGIVGDEFERVLSSLLAGGHLYFDEASARFHFVRNE